jgi:MOSC domain-containing protein YiiM
MACMTVVGLCWCPDDGKAMLPVQELVLVAGAGIEGDRYFGTDQTYPGQNLTLIEIEEIDAFNASHCTSIGMNEPRRNVITRGVRLNSLITREFTIGEVRLRGVQLCEPCGTLATHLAATGISKSEIVRAFAHRAGLRADVLNSGRIRVGDGVRVGA